MVGSRDVEIQSFHAGLWTAHNGAIVVSLDAGCEDITLHPFNFYIETGCAGIKLGGSVTNPLQGNLIPNGEFDNTDGWTAVDCTLASVGGGVAGNCLQITRTGAALQYAHRNISNLIIGATYLLSYYVKSGTSGNENAYVQCDPPATLVGVSAAGWVNKQVSFVATAVTATVYVTKNSATAGTMLFDQIEVKKL